MCFQSGVIESLVAVHVPCHAVDRFCGLVNSYHFTVLYNTGLRYDRMTSRETNAAFVFRTAVISIL